MLSHIHLQRHSKFSRWRRTEGGRGYQCFYVYSTLSPYCSTVDSSHLVLHVSSSLLPRSLLLLPTSPHPLRCYPPRRLLPAPVAAQSIFPPRPSSRLSTSAFFCSLLPLPISPRPLRCHPFTAPNARARRSCLEPSLCAWSCTLPVFGSVASLSFPRESVLAHAPFLSSRRYIGGRQGMWRIYTTISPDNLSRGSIFELAIWKADPSGCLDGHDVHHVERLAGRGARELR